MKTPNPENFDDGLTQVAPKGEFKAMKTQTENQIICNEDEQECWKCDRAKKGAINPCMVGQISQNCVVSIERRTDIENKINKIFEGDKLK